MPQLFTYICISGVRKRFPSSHNDKKNIFSGLATGSGPWPRVPSSPCHWPCHHDRLGKGKGETWLSQPAFVCKKKWANKYLANDLGLKPTSFNLFSKDLPAYALLLVREDKIHDSIFGPHPSISALSYKALFQTFEDAAPRSRKWQYFWHFIHCYILPCNKLTNWQLTNPSQKSQLSRAIN